MRCPQPSPNPSSEWRKFPFSIKAVLCFNALPLQALLGLLFSFCLFLSLLFDFPHERSPVLFRRKRRILRIRGLLSAVACGNCCSQTAHTASTGSVTRLGGVVSLRCSQNRTQGLTRAFSFWLSTCSTFPLRGKAGLNRIRPALSARIRLQLAHTAPTGPVWGFGGAFPLPGFQNRTQGHTGPSLVSPLFSGVL